LVLRHKNREIYTVRYDAVNAMLLNEFLKGHKAFVTEQQKVEEQGRKIQEQEATIAQLQKQVEALVAHANEQDSRIQKVSDRIEARNPAAQVVLKDQ
jgi:vacuolar-type H+-ATPase subunit I/STV1